MLMDRAYEGNETRQLCSIWHDSVVPRIQPTRSLGIRPPTVQKRNESREALPPAKGFPPHLLRFEKLDVVFLAFLNFALIVRVTRLV